MDSDSPFAQQHEQPDSVEPPLLPTDDNLAAAEHDADEPDADTALDAVEKPPDSEQVETTETTAVFGAAEAAAVRELLDQTETRVKCEKCGTKASWKGALTPAMVIAQRGITEDGLPLCPHCGTPMEPIPLLTAPDAIAQAAAELDADRAGNAARPMYQPALPGTHPPFDYKRAQLTSESLERNVATAEEAWDDAKQESADRKKEFDAAVEALRKHIQNTHSARVDAEYEAARASRSTDGDQPVTDGAGGSSSAAAATPGPCWSELKTGKPCPICRNANAAPTNAQTVEHIAAAAAVGAVERTVDADGMAKAILAVLGLWVPVSALVPWAPDDYTAAATYLEAVAGALAADGDRDTSTIPRPAVLGQPHEVDTVVGRCRVCGALLHPLAVEAGLEAWAPGQLVGIDCAGDPAQEPARPPTPRHAKPADRQRAKQTTRRGQAATVKAQTSNPSAAREKKRMAKAAPKAAKKGTRR